MTPEELLVQARKLLCVPDAWTQHAFVGMRDGQTCRCPVGAIRFVAFGSEQIPFNMHEHHLWPIYELALKRLRTVLGITTNVGLYEWNDHPARCLEDVLTTFDSAIALA